MKASRQVTLVFSLILVGCVATSVLLLRRLDQLRSGATLEEVLYISSPKALKKMSLGYSGLLADIYWTRAVQYFGGKHHNGARNYDLLAPLLEITTTLDPQLLAAYEYGANFLAPKPPNGAGMPERAMPCRSSVYAIIRTSGGCITTRASSATWICRIMPGQQKYLPAARDCQMRIPSWLFSRGRWPSTRATGRWRA